MRGRRPFWILLLCGVFALGSSTATAWAWLPGYESEATSDDSEPVSASDQDDLAVPVRSGPVLRRSALTALIAPLAVQEPTTAQAVFPQPAPWLSVGNGTGGPLRC